MILGTWMSIAAALGSDESGPRPTKPPAGEQQRQWQATGTHGAVAAGGAEAVAAGLGMLRDGGNAADAAATTLLAQSVTDANQFCFGGEVPILVYEASSGVVEVLAGQGGAPRLATRAHFVERGGIPARDRGRGGPGGPRRHLDPARPPRHPHLRRGRRAHAPYPGPPRTALARRPGPHDPRAHRGRADVPGPPPGPAARRRLFLPGFDCARLTPGPAPRAA